jgi:hypothetical protein
MTVPVESTVQMLAAIFPGLSLTELDPIQEFAGEPRRSDEDCYCGLVGAT